jgi:hypothetical protein
MFDRTDQQQGRTTGRSELKNSINDMHALRVVLARALPLSTCATRRFTASIVPPQLPSPTTEVRTAAAQRLFDAFATDVPNEKVGTL